ncbi:uridine kinase [Patescibacteria group bacterium]
MKPFLIGLCGFSGAGKSTLAEHLEAQGGVKRFRMDAYYKDEDECPKVDSQIHWDLPESLHLDQMITALGELSVGHEILMPIYNRGLNKKTGQMIFSPSPVIFTEGLMLFSDPQIRDFFDLRLWLDVSEETALERRLQRQPDYDLDYYRRYALPGARAHVAPHRLHAQKIIDGSQSIKEVAEQTDFIIRKYLGL